MQEIRKRLKTQIKLQDQFVRKVRNQNLDSTQIDEGSNVYFSYQNDENNIFDEKYQILEQIGAGCHGVVKLCQSRKNKQKFAVKIMRIDEQMSFIHKKNFLVMKCLRHQNIIKYKALYIQRNKKSCYLVMEYIDAKNLHNYKVQDEAELKIIISEILRGLKYMHSKNICHRDLKTENILYCPKEKKIKIVDFGICKKMTKGNQKTQMLTPTGTFIYKAPQMFTGEDYDEKVDLWALGVIMYELITKKNPFIVQDAKKTQYNIQHTEISFDSKNWDNYSKLCKDLVIRLLKKDRNQRLNTDQAMKHLFFEGMFYGLNNSERLQKTTQKQIAQKNIQTYLRKKDLTKTKSRSKGKGKNSSAINNCQSSETDEQQTVKMSKKSLSILFLQSEDQGIIDQ